MDEIGSTLREARMRERIDISEVEARTKIRAKYLRAIENEEWDLLPGTVYAKSFLRTYGDFLGPTRRFSWTRSSDPTSAPTTMPDPLATSPPRSRTRGPGGRHFPRG